MEKSQILEAFLAELNAEFRRLQEANKQASESATDSEFRAESKWDTGGIEASYLARGYAQQFARLTEQANRLRAFSPGDFAGKAIALGALVECDLDGHISLMFLLPCGGGTDLTIEDTEVTIVTPDSPLGTALLNKRKGETYHLPTGATGRIIRVE
jgi:transcription elongation GreA/GreB family factor